MGRDTVKIKKVKRPSKAVMKLNRKKFLQDMLDFNKRFFEDLERTRIQKENELLKKLY
jgi:hypothetical protein